MIRWKNEDFTREELMQLIPKQFYKILSNASIDEFKKLHKFKLNIDEQYPTEILLAFSYYETLTEKQRIGINYGINNISLSHLLNFIAMNNEKLLNYIEAVYDKDPTILDWLEYQIERIKLLIFSFDERIEAEKNGLRNQKTEKIGMVTEKVQKSGFPR